MFGGRMKQKTSVALLRVCVIGIAAVFIGADRLPPDRHQPRDYTDSRPSATVRPGAERPLQKVAVAGLGASTVTHPTTLTDAPVLEAALALPFALASADLAAGASAGPGSVQSSGSEEDDFYAGLRVYERGDKAKAIEIWRKAALQDNDLFAQNRLGTLYRQGRFVLQNHAEAFTWHTLAIINTNLLTDTESEGYARQTAAKKSSENERLALRALMTEEELDVARRTVVALYERKGPQGLFELAQLFANGTGLDKNPVEAYRYYVIASFFGSKDAINARDALARTIQPAQVAAAQRAAAAWKGADGAVIVPEYAKAVEPPVADKAPVVTAPGITSQLPAPASSPVPATGESKPGESKPGDLKDSGPKPETAQSEAPKETAETTKAPEGGSKAETPAAAPSESEAKLKAEVQRLAAITIVALDKSSTDTAAAQQALRVLGHFRGRPDGRFGGRTTRAIMAFQRNAGWRRTGSLTQEQFVSLLVQAARREDAASQLNLGILYAKGRFAPLDGLKALEQLKPAARQGLSEAHYQVGVIYRDGIGGVPKDVTLAAFHFREARKRKHPLAEQALRGLES